ncbi:MAG: hypothetical protein KF802_16075 [Bdellovibrionaceae bacterium]|nr:hypothetical protein [Pseudobdellovibrionaceae bacterium]
MRRKAAVICINYKTENATKRFISSLKNCISSNFIDIFIADNSPPSDRYDFGKFGPDCQVFQYQDNPGYFGAAQRILECPKFFLEKYDWVIVANNDIEFRDERFLYRLFQFSPSEYGVLAPSIIDGFSGRDSNPFMRTRPQPGKMRRLKILFSNPLLCQAYHFLSLFKEMILSLAVKNSQNLEREEDIYAAHGAFMIFSRAYFANGLDFSHGSFLFGEEVTVAERCRITGLRIHYKPSLRVHHIGKHTMGRFYSRHVLIWKKDSSKYIYETWFRSKEKEG